MRKFLWVLVLVMACVVHAAQDSNESSWVDGPSHEGVEVMVDLPPDQHVKNFGAPNDGLGLCVFASMDMAARWHHMTELIDVIHKVREGGGWPEKVSKVLRAYAPQRKFLQYEGVNPEMLDSSIKQRIPVCVTYGYSPRYRGLKTIYHMVILVHIDAKWACIVDNNFPGTFEWMSRAEFLRRWVHPSGKGWAYTFLEAPPPPIPRSS